MLPTQFKLTSPTQFRRVIKRGRRVGSRTVVVHAHVNSSDAELVTTGPRFGLVVSKAVGNAVIRHRTSRRLRHVCMDIIDDVPETMDIVIRALPPSGEATSAELEQDLRTALARIRKKLEKSS
ncbi:ribonuclease P protein component [Corynebacterium sp. L4756]|uniref:ribonuclease P protein component n=1 Tax=unclassified Corynebacterium TaxID=2624378 RepID=UPI00374DE2CD